jgi:lipopolysaccharide export system permease protein
MLFDTTLRRELSRAFGGTLVVILTIVLTMMLIRTLGQAAGGAVSPQDVVLLLGYTALGHLPTMLALSLFIAVVAALGRMYRDSEMAIWFAGGLPITRFVRPVLRVAGRCCWWWRCRAFVWPGGSRQARTCAPLPATIGSFRVARVLTSRDGKRVCSSSTRKRCRQRANVSC